MIDIDNFKDINDQFGQDIGDLVIKSLVNLATSSIRASDIIARFGGEGFVALFPDTNLEGARTLAVKIRSHIEATSANNTVKYTVSIGVPEFTSEEKNLITCLSVPTMRSTSCPVWLVSSFILGYISKNLIEQYWGHRTTAVLLSPSRQDR